MEKALANRIGVAARNARKTLGLTQDDAAERVGISPEFYARIERGGTMPSVPTLVRICDALSVSADVLLGRAGEPADHPRTASPGGGEPPALRRLIRKLRRAQPRTLRLLGLLATELERRSRRSA